MHHLKPLKSKNTKGCLSAMNTSIETISDNAMGKIIGLQELQYTSVFLIVTLILAHNS